MIKNNLKVILFFFFLSPCFSQDSLKIMTGQDLKSVFFQDDDGAIWPTDNFQITSFDASGKKIPLCINENLEIIINCPTRKPYGKIINSIIYDMEMNEIGRSFLGKIVKKDINDFWSNFEYWKGNISIYDKTESYRLATFMNIIPEKDYYSIMDVDSTDNIKTLNKAYKKLMKKYNINKYPEDEDIISKNKEINEAYIGIAKKIDPDYVEDKNWFRIFFSKNRRSGWSNEEGYVPYTKRKKEDIKPVTQEEKERYPYIEE